MVQVNAPYRPAWVARLRGMRALFRLFPFVRRLWRQRRWRRTCPRDGQFGLGVASVRGAGDMDRLVARRPRGRQLPGRRCGCFFRPPSSASIRPTLARAGIVVVPSAFLNAIFAKYGVATSIVPNIVNLDAFCPAAALPDKPHLLVTRNLEPIYDIGVVIRAFAIVAGRHADARLTVAGSGPDRAMLERTAAELGVADRVRFTGRVDNAELPAFYRAASVVVNASLVDNLPISLLEAMASGVPIATTDVGGIPYVVEHEVTALLVPPARRRRHGRRRPASCSRIGRWRYGCAKPVLKLRNATLGRTFVANCSPATLAFCGRVDEFRGCRRARKTMNRIELDHPDWVRAGHVASARLCASRRPILHGGQTSRRPWMRRRRTRPGSRP